MPEIRESPTADTEDAEKDQSLKTPLVETSNIKTAPIEAGISQTRDAIKAAKISSNLESLAADEARFAALQQEMKNNPKPTVTRAVANGYESGNLAGKIVEQRADIWMKKYSFGNLAKKLFNGFKKMFLKFA